MYKLRPSIIRDSRAHLASGRQRLQVVSAVKRKAPKQIACSKSLKSIQGKQNQLAELCKSIYDFSTECKRASLSGIISFDCFQVSAINFVFCHILHIIIQATVVSVVVSTGS